LAEDDAFARQPDRALGRSSAERISASRSTAGIPGLRARLFSSISCAASDWSSEPQLAPMRTGLS
jgi:hypothetical protein